MVSHSTGTTTLTGRAPPPKATTRVRLEEALEIATDAYVYAFPLVLMEAARKAATNVETPCEPLRAPINQFAHARAFQTPDSGALRPSADTLTSSLWLDLAREPIVVSVPSAEGRYVSLPIFDAWSNVFAAPGSRTTGTREQQFAVVGPNWRGTLPPGLDEVRSPTSHAWLLGRTQVNGPADLAAAHRFQDGLVAMPLSIARSFTAAPKGRVDPSLATKPALEQVTRMSALHFFSHFLLAAVADQPHMEDGAILSRMKRIGLEPGKICDFEQLPLSVRAAIHDAPKTALNRIAHPSDFGRSTNGWSIPSNPIGTYGTDYAKRAAVAYRSLGADTLDEAMHLVCDERSTRRVLDSNHPYVLHFEALEIPPVSGFWSLTLYNQRQTLAANPIDRHALSSRDPLRRNANGSLDIYLQREDPGGEKTANWLPTPAHGSFSLSMRLYWPRSTAFDGTWVPPALARRS